MLWRVRLVNLDVSNAFAFALIVRFVPGQAVESIFNLILRIRNVPIKLQRVIWHHSLPNCNSPFSKQIWVVWRTNSPSRVVWVRSSKWKRWSQRPCQMWRLRSGFCGEKRRIDPIKIGKLEVEQMGFISFIHLNICFPLIDDLNVFLGVWLGNRGKPRFNVVGSLVITIQTAIRDVAHAARCQWECWQVAWRSKENQRWWLVFANDVFSLYDGLSFMTGKQSLSLHCLLVILTFFFADFFSVAEVKHFLVIFFWVPNYETCPDWRLSMNDHTLTLP